MPYKYIGRTNDFLGKSLWEIVGNLKNFGVGRIVTRGRFQRYPELSYLKILSVEPLPAPENPSMDNMRRVKVVAERTFRGMRMPEPVHICMSSYKNDYQLVPKDEEAKYTGAPLTDFDKTKILPQRMELPPLMRELVLRESKSATEEDLQMEIVYNLASSKYKYRIAKEGEEPTVRHPIGLGTPITDRLYQDVDLRE
ncbi:uncharacterized protein LOC132707193 [Cylas formicarius]|uniref:uncharacterized protein LOC132707193 n=1 Tax=Cylas formicarius TaxID=197179 RepID=UPI0029589172|nr:uncharacterized protein LOC132707193 [Cylas formicarius]